MKQELFMGGNSTVRKALNQAFELEAAKLAARIFARL
jgi:hypothetical protein